MKIALVTCSRPPQEDFDAPPFVEALAARGHTAEPAAWDDPAVDWTSYDAALLRSTWDYFRRRDAFLDWAARTAAATVLWNPLDIVRWNTHKFYLRDLEARGVDIVPTMFLPAGSRVDMAALLARRGWDAAVLKPAVSADSFATMRVARGAPASGQAHLDRHLVERDMLVQQYRCRHYPRATRVEGRGREASPQPATWNQPTPQRTAGRLLSGLSACIQTEPNVSCVPHPATQDPAHPAGQETRGTEQLPRPVLNESASTTALDFGAASGERIVRGQDPCGFPPALALNCPNPLPPPSGLAVHWRKSLLLWEFRCASPCEPRAVVLASSDGAFGRRFDHA